MKTVIKKIKCLRCGYEWYPRTPKLPKNCANKDCNSPYWHTERRVKNEKNRNRRFYCKCDCGNKTISRLRCLRNGESKSCGCLKTEKFVKNNTKHGLTKRGVINKLHSVWVSMRQRCFNPKCIVYSSYGGRGIKFQTLTDAAKYFNVNVNTAYGRFKKGLDLDQVMGL